MACTTSRIAKKRRPPRPLVRNRIIAPVVVRDRFRGGRGGWRCHGCRGALRVGEKRPYRDEHRRHGWADYEAVQAEDGQCHQSWKSARCSRASWCLCPPARGRRMLSTRPITKTPMNIRMPALMNAPVARKYSATGAQMMAAPTAGSSERKSHQHAPQHRPVHADHPEGDRRRARLAPARQRCCL